MQDPGLAAALDLGMREATRLGLAGAFEVVRKADRSVTLCRLSRGDELVMLGLGRSDGALGRTSALFEALERFTIRLAPADGRAAITALAQQPLPPEDVVRRIVRSHPDAVVDAWTYDGPDGQLRYPTIVTNPFLGTDEVRRGDSPFASAYLRYSSGVGTAAGATTEDAALHGLLELVEHDAIGLALLRMFVDGRTPPAVVPPASMPPEVRAAAVAMGAAATRPVRLVDITTDVGIPSFMAVLEISDGKLPIVGSAAVSSPVAAALKAIGEVEQMWVLHGESPDEGSSLAEWPVLERCRQLRFRWDDAEPADVDWTDPGRDAARGDLDRVMKRLESVGLTAYRRTLTSADAHIAVVSCLVPGLERFSLVRNGHPVVPTGRGRSVWDDAPGRRT